MLTEMEEGRDGMRQESAEKLKGEKQEQGLNKDTRWREGRDTRCFASWEKLLFFVCLFFVFFFQHMESIRENHKMHSYIGDRVPSSQPVHLQHNLYS